MNNLPVILEKSKIRSFNSSSISFCIHTGSSMNPILQNFDILEIEPYKNRQICTGDIIYFKIPENYGHYGKQVNIVHRIIKITSKGIYTRGDNSRAVDPWVLNPDNIYGSVIGFSRSGKKKAVAGGKKGIWTGFTARRYCVAVHIFSKLLSRIYHFLAEKEIFRQLLPVCMRPCVVSFQAKEKNIFHITMGKKLIGRYDSALKRWIIKRPFRLFVNEKSLPFFYDKS